MQIHSSHEDIEKRLKRAGGHLSKIIKMIQEKNSCVDIAQQMHAVLCAVENAKKEFIHDHIDHCLEDTMNKNPSVKKASLNEFKHITKFL